MPRAEFTFIDLFAGIGGMRIGFEAAGGKCVFTSEWNKFSQETYRANFGPVPIAGDITDFELDKIPEHDVLVAGFPCQPFSLAGVSKKNALGRAHGFADEAQGTLFFEIARILESHRPKAFLLENVKNLKSHDGGETFKIIMRVLKDLGYSVQAKIVDAKGFVPQHRERIFLVGFREECGFSWDAVDIPDPSSGPRLDAILHPEDGSEYFEERFTFGPKAAVLPKYTLTEPLWAYLQQYAAKHRAKGNGFGFGLVDRSDIARTLSARYYKDGAEILLRQDASAPRRLTPRECSRLMGFDEPGARDWVICVSDTQAYRQFGNAVVPPVVEAIAITMAAAMSGKPVVASEPNIFSLAA